MNLSELLRQIADRIGAALRGRYDVYAHPVETPPVPCIIVQPAVGETRLEAVPVADGALWETATIEVLVLHGKMGIAPEALAGVLDDADIVLNAIARMGVLDPDNTAFVNYDAGITREGPTWEWDTLVTKFNFEIKREVRHA